MVEKTTEDMLVVLYVFVEHMTKIGPSPHCTESYSYQPAPAQECPTQSTRYLSANPSPPCTSPKNRGDKVFTQTLH